MKINNDLEKLEQKIIETDLPWLRDRMIMIAPTGSYAYGTNHINSDKDYKGICVPPKEYYLGLKTWNEYNTNGGKNFKNSAGDVDLVVVHISKFVLEAMSGVPNSIELLFLNEHQYLFLSEYGQTLVDNRHLFLSKSLKKKYAGYAISQMQKLKVKGGNGTGRQDLVDEFGFDVKFASHAVRLLTSAEEIALTGNFSTYRPNRELLVDIRLGKYTYDEVIEMIEYYDHRMKEAFEKSELPETCDYDKINSMLIELNEQALYNLK